MENFYSYKNKMPEENLNLEGNVGAVDPTTEATPVTEDSNVAMQDMNDSDSSNLEINEQTLENSDLNEQTPENPDLDEQNFGDLDLNEQTPENPDLDEQNFGNLDLNEQTPENPDLDEQNFGDLELSEQTLENLDLSEENAENLDASEQYDLSGGVENTTENTINNTEQIDSTENIEMSDFSNIEFDTTPSGSSSVDNNVFLDYGEDSKVEVHPSRDTEGLGQYLRLFFCATIIATLGIIAGVLLFSFNSFISKASQNTIDPEYEEYVKQYKEKLGKVKSYIGKNYVENYSTPNIKDENAKSKVNEIINATDIDYIEKKDLLSPFVSGLVKDAERGAEEIEVIKQEIAKQGFLPEEINQILSEDQAIDTIQRSLNALEVIKFSTATKVFSYMETALTTISEMIKISGSSVDTIRDLLNLLNSRGENDISAYVYMCYLNPFETSINCDTIGDLDLYYSSIIKDDSINIKLFKNAMNAINQVLEKADSALFSITFNGFNAQDKDISFRIEVFTNQNDERSLMAQGQRNPNIFIIKNIINLLKESSFIIGENILTKEINVETKTISRGGISTKVSYSNMDFTVPLQKNTEREIFDYIDLDKLQKSIDAVKDNLESDESDISNTEDINTEDQTELEDNEGISVEEDLNTEDEENI